MSQPKVAIVHDWLYGGGAERVTHELHKLYPDAPIYTSYCSDEWRKKLDDKIVTGYLQRWPFSVLRKYLAVLRIWWVEHLDLSDYDVVISVSGNGEAFGVRTPPTTLHINYCHTPTHYYWRHYAVYMKNPGFGIFNPLARLGLRLLIGPLKKWDYKAAQRADYFIANSKHIQSDIEKYYGRDSIVIHPPVDVERFTVPAPKQRTGFVTADRQVPAKHIDLIIKACNQLRMPLSVIGYGPEHERLKAMAGPTIQFFHPVSDQQMPAHFAGAQAFIKASFEDFGVVPVEAMAAGTPVIAYKAGGALDYVDAGKTGAFFDHQTVESLAKALKAFDPSRFDHKYIQKQAAAFSPTVFAKNIKQFVEQTLERNKP